VIYTCYEMVRDCRANRAEGWTYFLRHYVPVVRRLVAHYFPEREVEPALIQSVSELFQSLEPLPERSFVAELRQHVLKQVESNGGSADLEILAGALEPLTLTEKLVVWLETMRYTGEDTGRMLHMSAQTAEKIRARAAELLRNAIDDWSRSMLVENGRALGQAAAEATAKECLPAKAFLDVIDGRTTWRGREEMERHVKTCWHCLDHFCRLMEVVDLLRARHPLDDSELETYQRLIGITPKKHGLWKRAGSTGV